MDQQSYRETDDERGRSSGEHSTGQPARRTVGQTGYRTNVRTTYHANDPVADGTTDRTANRTTYRSQPGNTRSSQSRRSTQQARSYRSSYGEGGGATGRGSTRAGSGGWQPRQTSGYGRQVYAGASPSAWQRLLDAMPDNVWVSRAIVVVALLLLVFILFNLVTCIGGALAPKSESTGDTAAAEAAGEGQEQSEQAAQAAAAAQGVESPWTDDGRFSTGDTALDTYVKQLCDEHTSSGATFDQGAYDTYIYVSRTDYVERENNQSPWGETWDVEYAKQYFEAGNKGNCYNFAAVTEYVLKYFGYSDAEAEPCIVKLESGAWGDHGLVFVTNKVDGKRCIVDDALSANGWMLDINDYDYDVRNIAQNSTIKGNVDALDDDDNPTPIPPGELTEEASNDTANAAGDATGAEGAEGEATEEEYYDESADEQGYTADGEEPSEEEWQ